MRQIILPMLIALPFALAACGGGDSKPSSKESAQNQPTAMERKYNAAVVETARSMYPDQGVTAASCKKVGFTPGGDTIECTIATNDMVTEPSRWTVAEVGDPNSPRLTAIPDQS